RLRTASPAASVMEPGWVDRDGSGGLARRGLRPKVSPGGGRSRARAGPPQCANALLPNSLCIRPGRLPRFGPAACSEGNCDPGALAASIGARLCTHPSYDAIVRCQFDDPAIRLAATQSRWLRPACLRPAGVGNSHLLVPGMDR